MTRAVYFEKTTSGIKEILDDAVFNGFISQMFAWNIGARFDKNYNEDFIWRRALYLSSNACKLLREDANNQIAMKALKQSAEIYEYLSKITEVYDKDFCYILAALCYDISGYQANALCMMRDLLIKAYGFYNVDINEELNSDLGDENYVLRHIQFILLKEIPRAFYSNKKSESGVEGCEDWLGIKLFDISVFGLYEHILMGRENSFSVDVHECYHYYLAKGNIFISHLLHLLSCRFDRYGERSIWKKLSPSGFNNANIWSKYVRLLTNDIYSKNNVKKIENRRSIFEFWVSQLSAIEQGVLEKNESFIIQMPTSAGKTFIAELAILDNLIKFPEKKCIYIAPFRALTNEKELELSQNLSKLGYSVSSLSGDYEVDEFQNFILNSTDVLIATPEKLDLLYRLQNNYFNDISLLIIDEGHIIGDINERAALLEFLVIRLKIKIPMLKILFISAVMPPSNGIEFSKWLSQKEDNVVMSPENANESTWEPTRKLIGKFSWYTHKRAGEITYPFDEYLDSNEIPKIPFVPNFIWAKEYAGQFPNNDGKGQTAVSLAYKLSKSGSTLIFTSKPNWAESTGIAFLKLLNLLRERNEIAHSHFKENVLSNSFYVCSKWLGIEHNVTKCVKNGIGIHHGDLPEHVRKSIESDYRSENFKVLISTNTIGQGVNFPIKNLIIHSLDIDLRKEKDIKISVRDFWNIIGRAGRAGKETEGQVVFISSNNKDEKKFIEYTDKSNIEKAESIFSLIVKARLRLIDRITEQEMNDYIDYYSEPFLMSLLVEESVNTEDGELIEQVIGNSLFRVQTSEISLLKEGFIRVVKNIRNTVPELLQLKAFSSNGLSLNSNIIIENFIEHNITLIKEIIEHEDNFQLLEVILSLFSRSEIKEIQFSEKLKDLDGRASDLFPFIKDWILGKSINELSEIWENAAPESLKKTNKMFIFFSQGLNYKYPWGITAFLTILTYKLGITINDLSPNIRSLSSFVKYGVDDNLACFLISLGIKSRELAKLTVNEYSGDLSYEALLSWISNLTYEQISSWNLPQIEKDNIVEVSLKYNINQKKLLPESFIFDVKGTYFIESARSKSFEIKIEDFLDYKRDIENEYDPFAIKLMHESFFVGYIPREFSKLLSLEIDLFNTSYSIKVIEIKPLPLYNKITVLMSKLSSTTLS